MQSCPSFDLSFLHSLPGLRQVEVVAKVKNDLDAFLIEELERLVLVTGSRKAIPDCVQGNMKDLCLVDRPGISVAIRWPRLTKLRLGKWRGTSCANLVGAHNLKTVYLEGTRQAGSLSGIENCESLEELTLIDYSIEDSSPLRELDRLTRVKLMARRPAAPHGNLRISDIGTPGLSSLWIGNASAIRDLGVLAALPNLREVRLVECSLSGSDRETLTALPSRIKVTIVD
jgi:hypothetical protein